MAGPGSDLRLAAFRKPCRLRPGRSVKPLDLGGCGSRRFSRAAQRKDFGAARGAAPVVDRRARRCRDSTPPEKSLRVCQFRTRRVGLAGLRDELLEVRDGLLPVAGGVSGAPGTGEAPIAVRVLLERGLELP